MYLKTLYCKFWNQFKYETKVETGIKFKKTVVLESIEFGMPLKQSANQS